MPTPPIDLAPIIEEAAQSPLSVVSDGLEVTAQPLAAMIEADRYASAKAARARPFGGAMFAKVLPAGPVSDNQATGFGGLGRFDSPGGVV